MFKAISTGVKIDASRTFIIFFTAFAIMSTFGILKYVVGDTVERLVLYVPFFAFCFYYLKVFKLFNDFKNILNESSSFDEFNTAYAAYIERKDYLKFRKVTIFMIGWATLDLFWIFKLLLS